MTAPADGIVTRATLAVIQGQGGVSAQELEFLKQVRIFTDLAEGQLEALVAIVRRTVFPEGAWLIREGETGERMYILLDGIVEVSKSLTLKVGRHTFQQTDKSLSRLEGRHHACLGEMGLIDRDERSASVQALTECLVFEIDRVDFDRFCEADAKAGYLILRKMVQVISERLRSANHDTLKLTTALSLALSK